MIENNNYITILGWMVNDLGLSGNELLCYSIIYGFCQDNESAFNGSRKYIAEWLGVSLPTVDRVLKNLVEKGLIRKIVETKNNVIFNSYKLVKSYMEIKEKGVAENFIPYKNSLGGYKNSLHDIDKYNNKKKENILKEKKERDDLFEKCWVAYRRKGSKKQALYQWQRLTDDEKGLVLPHVKAYVSSREIQYQKDFERYLRDRVFKEVVYSNNQVVYDPTKANEDSTLYMPELSPLLAWNDYYKCYMYLGYFDGHISDGYEDDTRPDGVKITLNNGRGDIVWDSKTKKWIR